MKEACATISLYSSSDTGPAFTWPVLCFRYYYRNLKKSRHLPERVPDEHIVVLILPFDVALLSF